MKSEMRSILLFLGVPLAGLVYCGLGIVVMANSAAVREHALISGAIFILIPFTIAASIWISASAKAYKK
jgi:hypothetical protein